MGALFVTVSLLFAHQWQDHTLITHQLAASVNDTIPTAVSLGDAGPFGREPSCTPIDGGAASTSCGFGAVSLGCCLACPDLFHATCAAAAPQSSAATSLGTRPRVIPAVSDMAAGLALVDDNDRP